MSGTTPAVAAAAPTGDQGLPLPALEKQSPDTAATLDNAEKGGSVSAAPEESTILTGKKLAFVFAGMMTALFTIALDQLVLAPALPKIVSEFQSLSSTTWVAGSFLLVQTGMMPFFGQVCALYTSKYVFLVCITIFEVGSVVAGAAPNINALIVGRAITGLGASGMMISMMTLMTQILPLERRPAFMGLFGAVFGISSIVGPLLGGAFADHATWRWCFYLNPCVGVLGFAAIFFWVKPSRPMGIKAGDTRGPFARALSIDWLGATLVLGAVTCLVLATTWGGSTRGWGDGAVVACLVLCGVLTLVTIAWEMYKGDSAMIVTRLFRNPSLTAISFSQIATRWVMIVPTYYLPIGFQVIWNHSATKSGLDLLGLVLSLVITSAVIGIFVRKTGRYTPFLIAGPLLMALGTGLLFTIRQGTPFSRIIGFEILVGLGVGAAMQLGMLAAQAEYAKQPHLIPKVMGITSFFQMLGGILGLAVAGAIFDDKLHANLARLAPGVPAVVSSSPTELRAYVSGEQLEAVITSYSDALKYAYICCVPIAAVGAFIAIFIKNRPLGPPPGAAAANKQDEGGAAQLERKGSEGTLAHSADGDKRNSEELTTAGKA